MYICTAGTCGFDDSYSSFGFEYIYYAYLPAPSNPDLETHQESKYQLIMNTAAKPFRVHVADVAEFHEGFI